jgi:hypothetical protein
MTNQTIIATLLALAAYAAGKKGKGVPKQGTVEKAPEKPDTRS